MAKTKPTQDAQKAAKGKIDTSQGKEANDLESSAGDCGTAQNPDNCGGDKNGCECKDSCCDAQKSEETDGLIIDKDKYLRLAAEYENFRKRSAKQRESIYSDARADVISKLLPIYDNVDRALKMDCTDLAYYKGVEMIMTQLEETFSILGVKHIPAVGEQFDPNLHNAVMKIENPELGEGIIAEEYQKGFILGERVIRFSTVVVAN
ncbi:MAG: nucleotide exchange factor GrpE [Oscillospiraceae bacterium]|nr:nucleotide exchange factor GrpE [Oscillospiraceae bacterium]